MDSKLAGEFAVAKRAFNCVRNLYINRRALPALLVYSSSYPESAVAKLVKYYNVMGPAAEAGGPRTVAHSFIYFLTYRCTRSCSRFIGAGSSPHGLRPSCTTRFRASRCVAAPRRKRNPGELEEMRAYENDVVLKAKRSGKRKWISPVVAARPWKKRICARSRPCSIFRR